MRGPGARTRLSTFSAGLFLLILVVALGDVVAIIPMTALVAVMIFVSLVTFDWHSVQPRTLKRMPVGETVVMVATVACTVATGNLAVGVGVGVLVSMALFARRVAHLLEIERRPAEDGRSVTYAVTGELFFASNQELTDAFLHQDDPDDVTIDLSDAHLWDASSVSALDAVVQRYERHGARVRVVGLNRRSTELRESLAGEPAAAH